MSGTVGPVLQLSVEMKLVSDNFLKRQVYKGKGPS